MIRLIEALNYRCLRYVRQPMGPFHVLVGPNAAGKTTFLDVVAFLGQLVSEGPEAAIRSRSANPRDLVWNHEGDRFELAIECAIPEVLQKQLTIHFDTIRYEVAIDKDSETDRVGISGEAVLLKNLGASIDEKYFHIKTGNRPDSLFTPSNDVECRIVFSTNERDETGGYFRVLGDEGRIVSRDYLSLRGTPIHKPSLALATNGIGLSDSDKSFPVSEWLRHFLINDILSLSLNSRALCNPSPPGQGIIFKPDGSNLPLVVERFKEKHKNHFNDWIKHLQTAIPDLVDIEVIDRPEDRHRWLRLGYEGDLKVPSWMVSDGTLRLLALTLPAYLPDFKGVLLVEEPENGIHPLAIETMVQSMRSVYGAQVLMATHSPMVLGVTEPEEILCFNRNPDGSAYIVSGSEHPSLRDWKHELDLGTLFASGVLG